MIWTKCVIRRWVFVLNLCQHQQGAYNSSISNIQETYINAQGSIGRRRRASSNSDFIRDGSLNQDTAATSSQPILKARWQQLSYLPMPVSLQCFRLTTAIFFKIRVLLTAVAVAALTDLKIQLYLFMPIINAFKHWLHIKIRSAFLFQIRSNNCYVLFKHFINI